LKKYEIYATKVNALLQTSRQRKLLAQIDDATYKSNNEILVQQSANKEFSAMLFYTAGADKNTAVMRIIGFDAAFNTLYTQAINLGFSVEDIIVSGGNFHGQPLALALDFLGIALAELGSISERRTYQLISGLRGLPAFLVNDPGLNSGFMIPQYTAASIASQNKQLATPASIDSIVSSNGQEDHVSMGANAATKTLRIVENVERILAIELLNGSQALEFRRPLKSSEFIESFVKSYREEVSFVSEDRILHYDIEKSVSFLNSFQIEATCYQFVGQLQTFQINQDCCILLRQQL
jgi:hypothetical protein